MENSLAYKNFIEQLNATGSKKLDGYDPELFKKIYDWERDDIENIIWECFCKKEETDLAIFLPKLINFPGQRKLAETLKNRPIPSESSLILSIILYENSLDVSYFEIIKENIKSEPDDISFISNLVNCKPDSNIYNLLVETYLYNSNDIVRNEAVIGILYNKGIISSPSALSERLNIIDYLDKFDSNDVSVRKKILEQFEKNNNL